MTINGQGRAASPVMTPPAVSFALLWLAGAALRMTVLAVPPLLPRIHVALHLSETAVGALTALPVLLLAVASIFGSLVISRIGARRAMLGSLLVVALGGAARGVGSSIVLLFGMTFVMGIGIAVGQPALPSLVRLWLPENVPFASAVFANGMLIGEVVAAALTVPLVLPLVGGSWERALAVWSVLVLGIALAIALLTGHERRDSGVRPLAWWPDWRDGQMWRLGLILGGSAVAYFGSNAFIPEYLRAEHHPGYIGAALNCLNISQIPASILIAVFSNQMVARRWPFVVIGVMMALSAVGYAMGGIWVVLWSVPLGFSSAGGLVLGLALPSLLSSADDTHRLSAAMFSVSYGCAFLGSFVGGALWDASGLPQIAFLPVVAAGVAVAALTYGLNLHPTTDIMLRGAAEQGAG